MTTASKTNERLVAGWSRRKWVKIVIDVALLVGFLAAFVTREGPDYAVHSWIGIVLLPIIGVHLAGSLGWIKRVWARKRRDRDFNLGLFNAILGSLAGVCIATGFPIWLEWSEAAVWSTAHTITGFASILMMFGHLFLNRTRINELVRR
ncbi:MAG: hypothetical protein ACR2QO_28540 [Acidimicrobiales bacterium]